MHYIIVYITVCVNILSIMFYISEEHNYYIIIYIGYAIFDLYIFSYEFGIVTSGEGSVL